jgi:DNA repair protein RadC
MNVGRIILENQIEELMNVQGIGEASFLKLKALVVVTPPKTTER